MRRILLVGGGTGGHIYPLVAVAEELKNLSVQSGDELELRFAGAGGLLKEEAEKLGVKCALILSPKWRRYFSFQNFVDVLKFPVGFLQAVFNVWLFMPDVIFAKGGYGSLLPSLAGRIFAIPLIIHESDSVPGKTNRFLGKRARKIFLSFESSKKYFNESKCEVVGNPFRRGLLAGADKAAALGAFALNPDKPTVFITGASQGARKINEVLVLALVGLTGKFQVIHQCGEGNYEETNKQIVSIIKEGERIYGSQIQNNYRLYSRLDSSQLALAYSACDVVVSRASSQIFEVAAAGKPAVVIPLEGAANSHQLANAREFAKFGATVIEEANLTPHILINEIEKAFDNRAELSQRVRQFARPEAAAKIAAELLQLVGAVPNV
jgi:UDP-N-acetylglucosamine--N-acetylmuramyl-(pentapeptide) pyrophosphoryl-undecaprenol N-acetylglucosamine transferase